MVQALHCLKLVLAWFEFLSGMVVIVNYAKSTVFQVNQVDDWLSIVEDWDCVEGFFPSGYLGIPLGAGYKLKSVWTPLLDKLRSRLACWKRKYLSKGGCLVLAKSTLFSVHVYMVSIMVIPVSVALELELIIQNFIWGTTGKKRASHLVNWEEVCIPINWGGLGFKRVCDINTSLFCKWLWRLGSGEKKLWTSNITEKFGLLNREWFAKIGAGSYGGSLWRMLSGGAVQLLWKDFLLLMVVSVFITETFVIVLKFIQMSLTKVFGPLSFKSVLASDIDTLTEIDSLLQFLQDLTLSDDSVDKWIWNGSNGNFTVKSCSFGLTINKRKSFRGNYSPSIALNFTCCSSFLSP